MIIIVNGEPHETSGEQTLEALLEELQYRKKFLYAAVAINRKVVPESRWRKEHIREGDLIELINPKKERLGG